MATLNMGQSYPFTLEEVNKRVLPGRIGNYAYGYLNEQGSFVVRYVGRSDSNLRLRITHGLQEYYDNPNLKYERFKFSYASSITEAYEKECRNFHDFGGADGRLGNSIHPDSPSNMNLTCPICDL